MLSSSSRKTAPEAAGIPKPDGHFERNGRRRDKQQYTPSRDAFPGPGVLGAKKQGQGRQGKKKGTRGDESTDGVAGLDDDDDDGG